MTIKNKDGSIFQLKKPNPLMKSQDIENDNPIIHNFTQAEEITLIYKQKKQPVKPIGAVTGIQEPHPTLPQQPVAPTPKIIEPVVEDEEVPTEDKVSCWCLPGKFVKHVDKLYGETRENTVWEDKFIFDGVIINQTEMNFQIWSKTLIQAPSIIFVRADKRWWRVSGSKMQEDGFLMTCMPSDTRPRFD